MNINFVNQTKIKTAASPNDHLMRLTADRKDSSACVLSKPFKRRHSFNDRNNVNSHGDVLASTVLK